MAEAIINRVGMGKFKGYSAGSMPTGKVHPMTLELLNRSGLRHEQRAVEIVGGVRTPGAPELDFVFTVCDNAAERDLPDLAGPADDRALGHSRPVAAEGAEVQRALAFADTYRMLNNRISIFLSLPLSELDKISLQGRLHDIGKTRPTSRARRPERGAYSCGQRIGAECSALPFCSRPWSVRASWAETARGRKYAALALLGNTLPTGAILVGALSPSLAYLGRALQSRRDAGVFCLKRTFGQRRLRSYVLAQLPAAILGAFAAHLMFRSAQCLQPPQSKVAAPRQWFSEWVAAFGLVVTILATSSEAFGRCR